MREHDVLVILPGWGGSQETWQLFVELAKNDIPHTYVIDLPCFGEEPCPDYPWGIEEYADFARNKIMKIKADLELAGEPIEQMSLTVLGHSFGGAVAVRLVTKYPDLAGKLILAGAAVYRPNRALRSVIFGVIAKSGKAIFSLPVLKRFAGVARKGLYKAADSPDYLDTSGMKREVYKRIVKQDQSHLLPQITQPTAVLWGPNDKMTPLKLGERMAEAIPNATLTVIPEGTHGLHHETKASFLDAIKYHIHQ